MSDEGADRARIARRVDLAGQVAGHGAHGRILEEIGDFEPARIHRFDFFVDLRQRQRAGPQFEQVVVGRKLAARHGSLAYRQQRFLDAAFRRWT
jgi:hypothetical protein